MNRLSESQIIENIRLGKFIEKAPQMGSGKSKASDAAERLGGAANRAAKAKDKGDMLLAQQQLRDADKFLKALKKAVGAK